MTEANHSSWTEEDEKWLTSARDVQEFLYPVARRHGRAIFSIVMNVGLAQQALTKVASQGRGNQALAKATRILQVVLDDLAQRAIRGAGALPEHYIACLSDINLRAALTNAGGDAKVSKSGIILNS